MRRILTPFRRFVPIFFSAAGFFAAHTAAADQALTLVGAPCEYFPTQIDIVCRYANPATGCVLSEPIATSTTPAGPDLDPPQCTDECFDVGCGVLTIPVGLCITRTETCKSTNRADDGCTQLLDRVANEDVQTDFACLAGGGGDGGDIEPPAPGSASPIVIDLSGDGFFLTNAADGVTFDISGTGLPVRMGWIASGADNAFLALDRNDNGRIDDGTELFGNFSPQPVSQTPNGFLALAMYDLPENGGNDDGIIDERDAVFASLRLWTDATHDGVSQAAEPHTLPSFGVFSLGLRYHLSARHDRFGNQFRYRAKVNARHHEDVSEVGPTAYDVFFVTAGH